MWVVAVIGCCFGAGQLMIGASGFGAILLILLIGRPMEVAAAKLMGIVRSSELDHEDPK